MSEMIYNDEEKEPRARVQSQDCDNPFSEALFRTCKYRPDWPPKGFATKAEVQTWVKPFVSWYNDEHLHSAIRCERASEIDPASGAGKFLENLEKYNNSAIALGHNKRTR